MLRSYLGFDSGESPVGQDWGWNESIRLGAIRPLQTLELLIHGNLVTFDNSLMHNDTCLLLFFLL